MAPELFEYPLRGCPSKKEDSMLVHIKSQSHIKSRLSRSLDPTILGNVQVMLESEEGSSGFSLVDVASPPYMAADVRIWLIEEPE